MTEETDVVVVGAGIGGAVLAMALARRDRRVLVAEKEAAQRTLVRPEVLWGATPRALDSIGIGDLVRRSAVLIRGVEMRRSESDQVLLEIRERDFSGSGIEGWSTDPTATRMKILDAAVGTGRVVVEHSVEVRELLRNGSSVTGVKGLRGGREVEFRARMVVGDDGGNSIVRSALGISIDTRLFPLDFITALIRWPEDLAPDRVRIWFNPDGFRSGLPACGLIPWPERRGVMLTAIPHERELRDFWAEMRRTTPLASWLERQLVYPGDFTRVRRAFGHAQRYVADGAALIGDAIHPMTPAGGQGANASIADALALAEVVDEALREGDVSAARLAAYEGRRCRPNSRSVAISATVDRFFRTVRPVPGVERLVPLLLKTVNRFGVPRRGIRLFATAFE